MKLGVISDTHGHINPKVYELFAGVDGILHAGDIGSEDVITSLEVLAPVHAIHGNVDTFPLSTRYPEVLALEVEGVAICLIHQFINLRNSKIQNAIERATGGRLDILIYGHSHEASLQMDNRVLLFNPGAAGKQRFSLRPAVGFLTIHSPGQFVPQIVYLDGK